MAYLKPKEFYTALRKQEYKPVYLFAGEELYQQEEAWRYIEKKFGIDSLNLEIFYSGDMSVSDLMLAAQTHPFMSEKRLLLVKDTQKLKSADVEAITQFLVNPLDTVCLIFLWGDKVKRENKSGKLFKAIEKAGDVVEFRALYESELPAWVKERVKEQAKAISNEAVQALITESGSTLLDLNNEIDKLMLFTAAKSEITVADVESLSGHTRQSNLNNLSESIESGKTGQALIITENLLKEGEIPLKILATVYRVIRRLFIAKSLMDEKKVSRSDVQQELHLNPYFDKFFFNNLSKFTLAKLGKALRLISAADAELKSSSRPEQMVFEELILSFSQNQH
jgi:DNA polymerase-3 subunit delta